MRNVFMQIGVITSVFARAQLPLSQEFHAYVGPGRVLLRINVCEL